MGLLEKFIYYRSLLVGILATVVDSTVFIILSKLKFNDTISFIVAFILGVLIQFFGQKYWTFKNKTKTNNELIKQIVIFFIFEIIVFSFVLLIFNKIYISIENDVKNLNVEDANDPIKKIFVQKQNSTLVLTSFGKLFIKTVIVFFIFNLITYPVWKYILFTD